MTKKDKFRKAMKKQEFCQKRYDEFKNVMLGRFMAGENISTSDYIDAAFYAGFAHGSSWGDRRKK